MNTQPAARISVIIPHLNQRNSLKRCLASLRAGSRVPDQIIVVDNGSAVLPVDICSAFKGVMVLQQPEPGPGLARNLGVARSDCDILAFIDADCIAHPDWLDVAERRMADASLQIIGGDVRICCTNPAHLTALEAYESVFAYRMDRYIAQQGFTGSGNMVVRRGAFDRVGLFKGAAVAEDRDWGQRATSLGIEIRYDPSLIVFHPARATMTDLCAKWSRQLAHDAHDVRTGFQRFSWLIKAGVLIFSPLWDVRRIVRTDRIAGTRNRLLAYGVLVHIRLYRACKMVHLATGLDRHHAVRRWNRSDAN